MTDFIVYNFKVAILLCFFYMLYQLLLRRETLFQLNRTYLLGALIVALLVPALSIPLPIVGVGVQNNFEYVQHSIFEFAESIEGVKIVAVEQVTSFPLLTFVLLGGMFLTLVRVGFQLVSIHKKIKNNEIKTEGKYRYVLIRESHSTHSFFNYIFVRRSDFKRKHMRDVLLHEKIHVDSWHSLDMLLIGILSILQWFNPFIYLFKRALVETHEFQADQAVIKEGADIIQYQRLLLEHAGSVVATGFTSSFNHSIIKNRFKMMNKIESRKNALIKYLAIVPIVVLVGILFSFSEKKIEGTLGSALRKGSMVSVQVEDDTDTPSIYPIDEGKFHKVTSGFGMRKHPITKEKKMHNGMDFSADTGTPIKATASGTVRETKYYKSYGNRVIIDHGTGFSTSYSQMEKYIVNTGQLVEKGEVIGYVGTTGLSTGPHLHYEIMKDGEYVDPAVYLGSKQ